MRAEKKAPAPDRAKGQLQSDQLKEYLLNLEKSRAKRIAKRRADMPRAYRHNYDKAMSGRSLKAAVKAFCLECVQWDRNEVKLCPSVACPLYPYRPFVICSKNTSENGFSGAESTNTEPGV